ncbi:hypothetical protein L1F30_16840 [Simiduia sp. 21SJ11W-1]|uniref:hypothetical protein n=1 Tax=Simiduia sp. 21SJ11W-1 TaxID=2909669 RepID=UPI00209D7AC9|nr:hypothetical protein [Simiduia sp. 21SJ11W-1]UTA47808.1 hypothetical protein L1F30_16840 [Simiduia sp. 21SJ11W-1]
MGLSLRSICMIFCFLMLGCERYSPSEDAEITAKFSKTEIVDGEDFVVTFTITSLKNGVVDLPKNRLCSIRFLLRNGSGEEGERFCLNEQSEKVRLSPSKEFSFDVSGRLLKKNNHWIFKFADDVYVTFEKSDELYLMLEYLSSLFESESNIHLRSPIPVTIQEHKVFIGGQ